MKVLVDKSFERDVKRLPNDVKKELRKIVENLAEASTFKDIKFTKMEGAKNAFRISFGNYRIGIYLEGKALYYPGFLIERRFIATSRRNSQLGR